LYMFTKLHIDEQIKVTYRSKSADIYPFQLAWQNVLNFFYGLLQVGIQSQQSVQLDLFTLGFALFEPFHRHTVSLGVYARYHCSVHATCEQIAQNDHYIEHSKRAQGLKKKTHGCAARGIIYFVRSGPNRLAVSLTYYVKANAFAKCRRALRLNQYTRL
jgi:hypothetical protein